MYRKEDLEALVERLMDEAKDQMRYAEDDREEDPESVSAQYTEGIATGFKRAASFLQELIDNKGV